MPKRKDIKKILVIGAGPIIIGQACEFDYSGTQACKALKDEGYKVVLINSNPATIMTDPETADKVYIEPITPEIVEKIIIKEKPDVLLPTMGGQTALNIAISLSNNGVLKKYKVDLIGANLKAIKKAEERESFYKAMKKIGLDVPEAHIARTYKQAQQVLKKLGLPVIIRPSFTLGGTGGGIAYNKDEFDNIVTSGLDASPVNSVLIEESIIGWKEYEMSISEITGIPRPTVVRKLKHLIDNNFLSIDEKKLLEVNISGKALQISKDQQDKNILSLSNFTYRVFNQIKIIDSNKDKGDDFIPGYLR